jgi:hypothetical protein
VIQTMVIDGLAWISGGYWSLDICWSVSDQNSCPVVLLLLSKWNL